MFRGYSKQIFGERTAIGMQARNVFVAT